MAGEHHQTYNYLRAQRYRHRALTELIVAQSRVGVLEAASQTLVHLCRLAQPLRHHRVESTQVFLIAHGEPPVDLHQGKEP